MPRSSVRAVLGASVKSHDNKEALKVPGVQQTVVIETFKPPCGHQPMGGVAVIADNTWAAFQGRKKLKVEWDNGSARGLQLRTVPQDRNRDRAKARASDPQRRRRGCRFSERRNHP